jgi:hypothetical protein
MYRDVVLRMVDYSCQNTIINTSMTLLRRILSLSVNRYHELNDTHDNSMQSAYYRHFHWYCVYR